MLAHESTAGEMDYTPPAGDRPQSCQTARSSAAERWPAEGSRVWLERVLAPLMENMRERAVPACSGDLDEPYPEIGTIVRDTWLLTGRLGEGAFGQVFEAKHLSLGRVDAIKFLNPRYCVDRDVRRRFVQEARATAKFCDDTIVRLYDYGEHEGLPFFVMERLVGETLEQQLDRTGPLPISSFVEYAGDLLRAAGQVQARGVVHRDIKPANVFVRSGERGIKLLDFGLAKTSVRLTMPKVFMGTLAYAAPELLDSSCVEASHRTDLYAVGAVLYTMLAGRPPFLPRKSESLRAFTQRICDESPLPPSVYREDGRAEFDGLVLLMLSRDPDLRPWNARCALSTLSAITERLRVPRTIDVHCVSAPLSSELENASTQRRPPAPAVQVRTERVPVTCGYRGVDEPERAGMIETERMTPINVVPHRHPVGVPPPAGGCLRDARAVSPTMPAAVMMIDARSSLVATVMAAVLTALLVGMMVGMSAARTLLGS